VTTGGRSTGGLWSARVRRWLTLVLWVLSLPAATSCRSACDLAFGARAWDRVAIECAAPRWGGRQALARAWLDWDKGRTDEALAAAEQLLDTNVGPDAAYLAGYAHTRRDGNGEADLARLRLQQALAGYQRESRHAEASRAAGALSRTARPEMRFDDHLHMAQVAVDEGELSEDARTLGNAVGALAESYDTIGMASAARSSFLHAEELARSWPDDLAGLYFKHAVFLLELGTQDGMLAALDYFDAAQAKRDEATANGLGGRVARLALAIRLNRADALSQLGRLDAAEREIAAAEHELDASPAEIQLRRVRLVRGYIAARQNHAQAAESLFVQAASGSLDADYRLRVGLELARMYRDANQLERAEQTYRDAVAITEGTRSAANQVELRPWVLARRVAPYIELLALLVEQGRGVDALVVAESLHGRAWLDVVLGQPSSGPSVATQALAAARIRQRLDVSPTPPLDAAALMQRVGSREVLVFVTIGTKTWRAHIRQRQVSFVRLSDDAVVLAERFLATPRDPDAAEVAARALLPSDLAIDDSPLYVIASGALADVPFSALRLRGQYLIAERAIARLPGLAALRCSSARWDARSVVLGDSRRDLPGAAREAQEVADLVGAPPLVGNAASRAALTSARGARLLHIATHGSATPMGRAIVLADGLVTAADVLEAGIAPEVAVLAGCATAASDDAESWNGFPSAFLAAGSRFVVATLRSVEDPAAARVTSAYYSQPETMSPIARLAAAQRTLIDVIPVEAWSSFAAWGNESCETPLHAAVAEPAK
jgi:tetratricopeptide (TPR) repeat protein